MFLDDTSFFFQLLEKHFDISDFIPPVFYHVFYQSLGRKRLYPLTGFLSALILQKIFSLWEQPELRITQIIQEKQAESGNDENSLAS